MVLEGDAGVGLDRSGARGAGFAGLIGSEGFTCCFGAAEGFAGKRIGGLGGIREIGVATGSCSRQREVARQYLRCADGRTCKYPPCFCANLSSSHRNFMYSDVIKLHCHDWKKHYFTAYRCRHKLTW
jgi:hypothetical protein